MSITSSSLIDFSVLNSTLNLKDSLCSQFPTRGLGGRRVSLKSDDHFLSFSYFDSRAQRYEYWSVV